jgi:hypothetical protein
MKDKPRITVRELIEHLKVFDQDSQLIFGDDQLTFYRTKGRGDKLVQIEFNEIIQEVSELSTRQKNRPSINSLCKIYMCSVRDRSLHRWRSLV